MNTRVLVVEDDALLALDIARQLADAGLEVVGPATSVAKALGLVGRIGCDVAVLDVNLGKETAEPVARELRARGTPFVVLSGYSSEQHPPGFRGAPVLSKPARRSCCHVAQLHGRCSIASEWFIIAELCFVSVRMFWDTAPVFGGTFRGRSHH
jgi:CheY-like chemotaxis protein